MKNKVLRLCKRLNKVTIEEVTPILHATVGEICPVLEELVMEGRLDLREDGVYFYKEKQTQKQELPFFFEFHTKDSIELITKCFCSNIEVVKVMNLTDLSKNCICKFYSYYREKIYKKQLNELTTYFNQYPRVAQEREYMGKSYYLYLYNNKLFVSEKMLKAKEMDKFSNEDRLKIKNIYLRANRKVLNYSYNHFYHLHLSEELWRMDKSFLLLHDEISALCS